jgi:hypothetical protein
MMKIHVFWNMTPCQLFLRFKGTYCPHLHGGPRRENTTFFLDCPEDGGNILFRNIGSYLQIDIALYPTRLKFPSPLLWSPNSQTKRTCFSYKLLSRNEPNYRHKRMLNFIHNDAFVYLGQRFRCRKEPAILLFGRLCSRECQPRTYTNAVTLTP